MTKPTLLRVMPHGIPDAMKAAIRWVVWCLVFQAGRSKPWTKVPFIPWALDREASSTDPKTWGSFGAAMAAYNSGLCDGIGFVLGDGWVGFDADNCRDPQTGAVDGEAFGYYRTLNTFTEVSPTRVLGSIFKSDSWNTHRAVLKAAFALDLTDDERQIVTHLTQRDTLPTSPVRELWLLLGRRSGKSIIAALLAVWATCCRSYRLAPGEVGVFMVIAADRKQARVIKRYVSGLLRAHAALEALISSETAEAITLTNGLVIEIHTCSFRSLRGYTCIGAAVDEVAFWSVEDSANPDKEVLVALRAAMASVPEAMLIGLTSVYARRGEVWRIFEKHFGRNESADVLVVNGGTRTMNPTIDEKVIATAYEDDPVAAAAEYGAEFRRDVEMFLPHEALEAVRMPGRLELPYQPAHRYVGFLDPAGGTGKPDQRMATITTSELTAFVKHRQEQGASSASCNNELATIRRAFMLAVRSGELVGKPHIPMLTLNNTRQGFLERHELDAILEHLPPCLHAPLTFAYITGWRVPSEVLPLTAAQVDLQAGVVRLEPGKTKNKEARSFPVTGELRTLLKTQLDAIEAFKQRNVIVPYVFHRTSGKRIKDFRGAWKAACEKAGYPGKLLHDCRRSAVRSLERSGVPRSTAMAMVGHKTEAIYRRYAIVDEAMLQEGGVKLERWNTEQKAKAAAEAERKEGQVVKFEERLKIG